MTVIPLGGRFPRVPVRPIAGRTRRSKLLYEEVIDLIDRIIIERQLGPGDMLPSQGELAKSAKVSLITVRRALEELEREGRIRRHQGLGTFLARPKILSDPGRVGQLGSTLDATASARVGSQLLGIERCLPTADIAEALGLAEFDHVWAVRRIRLLDGKPSIIERAVIPVALAPGLDRAYSTGSLYETLNELYGIEDDFEEQILEVVNPTSEARTLLRLTAHAQVVRIRGVSRDKRGIAFDCFEQVYPAADFAFAIAGQTQRRLHPGGVGGDWNAVPLESSPGRRKS